MILAKMESLPEKYRSKYSQGATAHLASSLSIARGELTEARKHLLDAEEFLSDVRLLWTQAQLYELAGNREKALEKYKDIGDRKGWILKNEISTLWIRAGEARSRLQSEQGKPN